MRFFKIIEHPLKFLDFRPALAAFFRWDFLGGVFRHLLIYNRLLFFAELLLMILGVSFND